MNETQRSAAERLADAVMHPEAAALLRELAAGPVVNQQMTTELAEPVQEPVALMWQHEETGRVTFTTMADPYVGKRWHRIPLYAAAPQQPMHCPKDGGECGAGGYCRPEPVQRKPLTDDEALALIRATPQEDVTQEGWIRRQRLSWVRAIEHMHGITGEPT